MEVGTCSLALWYHGPGAIHTGIQSARLPGRSEECICGLCLEANPLLHMFVPIYRASKAAVFVSVILREFCSRISWRDLTGRSISNLRRPNRSTRVPFSEILWIHW
jgi:hypothetical protein